MLEGTQLGCLPPLSPALQLRGGDGWLQSLRLACAGPAAAAGCGGVVAQALPPSLCAAVWRLQRVTHAYTSSVRWHRAAPAEPCALRRRRAERGFIRLERRKTGAL
jgi:hypothetical protein